VKVEAGAVLEVELAAAEVVVVEVWQLHRRYPLRVQAVLLRSLDYSLAVCLH
jgi:hypothetical protein